MGVWGKHSCVCPAADICAALRGCAALWENWRSEQVRPGSSASTEDGGVEESSTPQRQCFPTVFAVAQSALRCMHARSRRGRPSALYAFISIFRHARPAVVGALTNARCRRRVPGHCGSSSRSGENRCSVSGTFRLRSSTTFSEGDAIQRGRNFPDEQRSTGQQSRRVSPYSAALPSDRNSRRTSSTGKRLPTVREPRLDSRPSDQTTLCTGNSTEQHDRIGCRRHQRGRITRRTRPRTRIGDTPLESSEAHDFSCTLATVRRPRCMRKLSRVTPDRCGPEHLLPTVKEHSPLEGAVLVRRRREQSGEQWTKT